MCEMPVFYHKSTLMIVDDDEIVLKAVSKFFQKKFIIKPFINPLECIDYYKNNISALSGRYFIKADVGHEYYNVANYAPVNLDMENIYRLSSDPERHSEISILVVDYNMPGINGIELCNRLSAYPVKKILLTGMASIDIAIDALNKGIIDCYLTKGSENLVDQLNYYVNFLSKKYYDNLTKPILSHLEADNRLPLSDSVFVDYVNKHYLSEKMYEYTLIDKNGSLILIDEDGKVNYLIVHTEKSLHDFIELNDDVCEADSHLKAIKNREKVPFFGVGAECWQFPVTEWDKYFFEPVLLKGRENYYISIIS